MINERANSSSFYARYRLVIKRAQGMKCGFLFSFPHFIELSWLRAVNYSLRTRPYTAAQQIFSTAAHQWREIWPSSCRNNTASCQVRAYFSVFARRLFLLCSGWYLSFLMTATKRITAWHESWVRFFFHLCGLMTAASFLIGSALYSLSLCLALPIRNDYQAANITTSSSFSFLSLSAVACSFSLYVATADRGKVRKRG